MTKGDESPFVEGFLLMTLFYAVLVGGIGNGVHEIYQEFTQIR